VNRILLLYMLAAGFGTSLVLACGLFSGAQPAAGRTLLQRVVPFRTFRRGERDPAGCAVMILAAGVCGFLLLSTLFLTFAD
jgi:hypothetical protein